MAPIWLNDCKNLEVLPVAPTLNQATCHGGVVKPPSVTVADKPLGVTYTVAPTPLGDGSTDVAVTVTATLTSVTTGASAAGRLDGERRWSLGDVDRHVERHVVRRRDARCPDA